MKHSLLRRAGALVLALALALPMAVTTAWADDDFTVSLDKTSLTLSDSQTLTATPQGVDSRVTYEWKSTNNVVTITPANAATVTVKPIEVGSGEITVTATWTGGDGAVKTAAATCPVTVDSVPVERMAFHNPSYTMKTGETQELELTFTPSNATYTDPVEDVNWRSSDEKIATVDSRGVVTAIKEGTVTISASSRQHQNVTPARCMLTITDSATPTVTVTPDSIRALMVGDLYRLTAEVTPGDVKSVAWRSTNQRVATVEGDQHGADIVAVGTGTTDIIVTVTGTNNKTATATRRVTVGDANSLFATSMTARGSTNLSLSAGEEMQLAVNVTPATAHVTWESNRPSVAAVDPSTGKMTAIAPGTATITATAQSRTGTPLTVSYEVTVMGRATGIRFNPNTGNIKDSADGQYQYTQFDADDGRTRNIAVQVLSQSGLDTNTYVDWRSSDTSIVTVTPGSSNRAELMVSSGKTAGKSTITATVYDSTTRQPVKYDSGELLSANLDVVVSGITLSASSLTMYEGESKSLSIANAYGEAEEAAATTVQWVSSDSSIVSMESGTLNAWAKGTATITATTRDGKYKASCSVTVTEDPGTVVSGGSAVAGNSIKLGTSSVISQMNSIARQRAGGTMEYITSIFITPAQGVVYNTYTSEADTGAGVSMAERYYVNRTTPAAECIPALSFVPNKSFSGEARISYIGYSNGLPISGVITVSVTGMGEGSTDVTYTANGAPVTFQAEDFNAICGTKTGRTLKYVTFTPPQENMGTLYENYASENHPGQKVTAAIQYNRTGSPNLSNVTFVPAEGYSGTVTIAYRAVDNTNAGYSGRVTINVNKADATTDPADIYYTAPQDGWATFRAADFANASLRTIGEPLSHVRFTLPPSSEGTLFHNYRGFGNYDSAVASTTSYYQTGTPALSGVTFVPATTSTGQAAITYTGYSTRGTTFTGKVYVAEGGAQPGNGGSNPGGGTGTGTYYNYTVNSGASVTLNASDFNSACLAATGATLSYIRFTSLPAGTQGTLRYRTGNSSYYNNATVSTSFYRTSTSSGTPLISNVSFLASATYTGVVHLPYIGYNTSGGSFTGEVTIQVTPNTIVYTGTTASPLRLSASRIRSAVNSTFSRDLSYIEFTSLPGTSAGRMYLGYSGYGTGTQVSTGVRYYASSTPGIDQISFVPKARYSGDAVAAYTAYSTTGERMTGQITFHISATGSSSYFVDMGSYAWAAPSVDYLRQNNVTDGVTTNTFGPSQQILRRDFVLMLYRAFKFSGGNAANPGFADVPANSYYAQAVSAARQMGIVSGDGRNFRPASPITRQDAMVMIRNAMSAAGKLQGTASTAILNNFPDGAAVSNYAREAVSTLVQMGAVNGSNGMLNPHSAITRAEAAVILHFVMTV